MSGTYTKGDGMSYEGRQQVWCQNGHYEEFDATDHVHDCYVCASPPAFVNQVDDTNGDQEGYIEPVVAIAAGECTCISCGNVHTTTPPTYVIPKKEENKDD